LPNFRTCISLNNIQSLKIVKFYKWSWITIKAGFSWFVLWLIMNILSTTVLYFRVFKSHFSTSTIFFLWIQSFKWFRWKLTELWNIRVRSYWISPPFWSAVSQNSYFFLIMVYFSKVCLYINSKQPHSVRDDNCCTRSMLRCT
jgi:hypothetical protein